MRTLKSLLAFLCATTFFISSCTKDSPVTNVPIITGIQTTDYNAEPIGVVGVDNSKTYTTNFTDRIVAYPNPCVDFLGIMCPSHSDDSIKVWMEAGIYKNPPSDAIIQNQSLYGKILNPFTASLKTGRNIVTIDTKSLPNGFYRVYLVTTSDTLYDNIWVKR